MFELVLLLCCPQFSKKAALLPYYFTFKLLLTCRGILWSVSTIDWCVRLWQLKCTRCNNSLGGWFVSAEPIWRQVPSAGPVCWASWRSCGDGSAWRMRIWPSKCLLGEMCPPFCNSRTTAWWVLLPQEVSLPGCTTFITTCSSAFSSETHFCAHLKCFCINFSFFHLYISTYCKNIKTPPAQYYSYVIRPCLD